QNPLWIHPSHAERLGIATGDLCQVRTRIGRFVLRAWVTEGIRRPLWLGRPARPDDAFFHVPTA
ncbi:hypothetical protein HY251_15280, partial [bacterium]|nr:hypothetical protein [bacterium]